MDATCCKRTQEYTHSIQITLMKITSY